MRNGTWNIQYNMKDIPYNTKKDYILKPTQVTFPSKMLKLMISCEFTWIENVGTNKNEIMWFIFWLVSMCPLQSNCRESLRLVVAGHQISQSVTKLYQRETEQQQWALHSSLLQTWYWYYNVCFRIYFVLLQIF